MQGPIRRLAQWPPAGARVAPPDRPRRDDPPAPAARLRYGGARLRYGGARLADRRGAHLGEDSSDGHALEPRDEGGAVNGHEDGHDDLPRRARAVTRHTRRSRAAAQDEAWFSLLQVKPKSSTFPAAREDACITTCRVDAQVRTWQSMRSVMPPCPGMRSPKSLILKARLNLETCRDLT
jgi:hypothetical protein